MPWNPWKMLSRRKPARRVPLNRARLALEELETRLVPSVNVLTFHDDIASTGLNANENQLTPANVKLGSFGKLYTTAVDGQVYAEPLVDTGVTIANGVNTRTGAAGVHDVVFVATEHDSLYAIDASVAGGAVLWQRTFLDATNPTGDINNTLNATAIGTVPSGDVNTGDISPEIGITGTPVIDPATNLMYVVVKTKETISGSAHYVQRLHAINVGDGTDAATPALIGDTTNGNTNNTLIYVYGSGDGNVTDPYNGTGRPVVQFNALREHQRGALNFVNNAIYVEWASHGDNGPYHGWVVEWDVTNVKTSGFQMKGVLNTSPNNGLSGIWQGGGRLAFEADGSAFYFETGNGSGGAPTLNSNGFPTNANYNEALVKVVADSTTSPTNQNPNGWGLKVSDYFIPFNVVALDGADQDFGSGAPMILPDSAGLPGHPHLLVAAGKQGKIYLVDRDNMGHFDPNNDHVVNAVPDGSGHNTPPVQLGGSLSTAAYFNGKIYWTSGYSSTANAYVINSNGTLSTTSSTSINFGSLPGSAVVSANGTMSGIAWIMDRNANQIHAYDATTFATELWNSGQKSGGGDNLGAVVKFAVPTVANGEVYVGTSNSLVVYGLTPPANAVPKAPVLAATALSGSSINLTWTDSTQPPNTATGYKIEQSPDGTTFTQVTTAPAGATSIAIGGLSPLTKYYFRIRGFNGLGDGPYSNIVNATTTNQVAVLDFSAGFAGSTNQLTYNGSAAINGTKAEVTNNGLSEAGSVFSTSPVDVTKFTTQFTFQMTAGSSTADGFTFTIQGVGPTALGPSGGGLGYGPDHTGGTGGIASSVAIKFDLYDNQGEGVDSTGLYTNGAAPTNVGSIDLTPSGLDLHSGDTFQVNMTYDGTTLSVTILDTVTKKTATQNYTINITGTVGNGTAFVGFTGGTGGLTVTTDILTWTFSPNSVQAPNAPTGLGATPATATSVTLNWTNNATNQTGFHLDRATDSAFTQNLITQTLPATPNSFTDTATGLAPGSTFYYRIRAFNTAGDSANSNMATVTIPLAPAKPTNAQVTNVTTSEVDLSWTDNAGLTATNYLVLRAVNHGSFVTYATLPAKNATPPSTYTWNDTSVDPGTFYEYHIEAINTSGNNDFSGTNTTTITLPPSSPAITAGDSIVNLSWTAPTGAVSYNIYRGTSAGGESTTALATGVTTTTFADSTVTNGTTYFYEVTAVNGNASPLPSESAKSNEVSATPGALFVGHVNFSNNTTQVLAGYINDIGQAYGVRGNGQTFGWNKDNTKNMRDRNNSRSPDELHDSFGLMQKPSNPNAWWGIAVPNGTYSVHLIAGDPNLFDSVFQINVGGTLSGGTVSGGTLIISGTPTSTTRWFENTVSITVTGGVLYVSNATGSSNNKIDAIDITETAPGPAVDFPNGFAGATGLTFNGGAPAKINGTMLQLTDGHSKEATSVFTSNQVGVAKFTSNFSFQLSAGSKTADGFTFAIQNVTNTALGSSSGGLGYAGIASSVALKFDLFNNSGEGADSIGVFTNGAMPSTGGIAPNSGSNDLTGSGIDLHSGHVFNVALSYDGTTLSVSLTDATTNASVTRAYAVNISGIIGSSNAFVGFTAGTGGLSSTDDILNWTFTPTP
jgi:fibronectin type 3 domain-containing protein